MAVSNFLFKDFLGTYGREVTFEELKRISFDYGMEVAGELENGEFAVDITPERPDMYSVEGYARALCGFSGLESGLKRYECKDSDIELIVEKETADVRPFIGAAVIRNVNVDDAFLRSMIRFQEKLHFTLGRKRAKVAIGIYDLDRISPPVHYKLVAPSSVRFVPLEFEEELTLEEILEKHPTGREYKHLLDGFERYPLLIDSAGNVLSFPPIINSRYSGKVTESTKNLFLEVTGTHEPTLLKTVNMLATSILDRCGNLERVSVRYPSREMLSPNLECERLVVNLDFVNNYLGLDLSAEETKGLLERMRYDVKIIDHGRKLDVVVPSYRIDVLASCDVVEDIAIAYGYGRFELREPYLYTIGEGHQREGFSNHIREICAGFGLIEVMTLILTNTDDQYRKMRRPIDTDYVSLLDPKSSEHSITRISVLPELMKLLRSNRNRELPISIFEVEDIIKVRKDRFTGTEDIRTLAVAEMSPTAEYSRIRSLVGGIFDNLGMQYKIGRSEHPYYLKGRQGDIYVCEKIVGELGEMHPQVIRNFDLESPIVAAEINLDALQLNVKKRI